MKVIVIGGVACGPKAAARIRHRDPESEITVIDGGKHLSYAGCGLPYFVAGAVPEIEGLMTTSSGILRDKNFFEDVKGINVKTDTEAIKIDREKKTVTVRDIESAETEELPYDKLVLATGASPVIPPIEGIDLKKVYTLRKPADAAVIRNDIEAGDADRICIIGAGRIGLEAADAFGAQAVDTTIVEQAEHVLPTFLDPEMADYTEVVLRKEKVEIFPGETVIRLEGDADGNVNKVITDKREIETDAVLIGVGVKPNITLAKEAGLETGDIGALAVDDHMRTNDPDIYAGGDCVECTNILTGKKVFNPLGSVANRQGRVIGNNVTGGDDVFPGVLGTSILKTLGINVAKTGLTETEAKKLGYKTVTSLNPSGDKSHFFPGGKYILLKLVVDAETRKILGAQAVGAGEVAKQIDTLVAAISFGATVDEAAKIDICHAPPFSNAISNVAHSCNIARNKLDGLIQTISPLEMKEMIENGDDFILLDLRTKKENEANNVKRKDVVCMPQDELRARIDELPKDKTIVVTCQVGLKTYDSFRAVIAGAGCADIRLLEGGLHVWFNCGYDD